MNCLWNHFVSFEAMRRALQDKKTRDRLARYLGFQTAKDLGHAIIDHIREKRFGKDGLGLLCDLVKPCMVKLAKEIQGMTVDMVEQYVNSPLFPLSQATKAL